MADRTTLDELDQVTAHDLREQGSLKWTKFGGDTIGAFVAEMDFGAAPPIVHALQDAVAAGRFGYLTPAQTEELARACAHWHLDRYGWQVQPEQVYPVSDVLTALEITMRHLTRPGSPIILPTPAYMPFLTVPALHGRDLVQVPMLREGERSDRYGLDLDGLDRAFRAGGHLLILCNPVNPVGRVLTTEELAAVTEVVDRHGGRVFADEVHAPLVYPGYRHVPYASTSATAAGHTVTATSASKAWNLPGLKCAQVILNPADAKIWREVGTGAPAAASSLGIVANTAAYRAGEGWLDELLGYLDRNRRALSDLLATHLPQVRYRPPEGSYLAWLDCRELGNGQRLGERLARPGQRLDQFFLDEAGVAMVDGADCGEAGRGHLRLNFATPLPILERAVTRMAHACRRAT